MAPAVGVFWAVLRFVGRSFRRLAIALAGFALLLAGAIMLLTPGPGLLAIIAGLSILATEYTWARRALERARLRSRQAVEKVRVVRQARREAARWQEAARLQSRDQPEPDS
jgi:uncharacterized protein (TIGR02611 family)